MADQERFRMTWTELETSAHVPVDDQVALQDVGVHAPLVPPEELDRQKALGVVGDFRLSR
jgi:hypothetical protein